MHIDKSGARGGCIDGAVAGRRYGNERYTGRFASSRGWLLLVSRGGVARERVVRFTQRSLDQSTDHRKSKSKHNRKQKEIQV